MKGWAEVYMGGAKHKRNTAGRRCVWARVRERYRESDTSLNDVVVLTSWLAAASSSSSCATLSNATRNLSRTYVQTSILIKEQKLCTELDICARPFYYFCNHLYLSKPEDAIKMLFRVTWLALGSSYQHFAWPTEEVFPMWKPNIFHINASHTRIHIHFRG